MAKLPVTSLSEPLHKILWEENRDLAAGCLDHAFVRGLGDGTLGREVFRRYVAQDAFFLRAFAKAYECAAARTGESETKQVFRELRDGVQQELELHTQYSKCLGIELEGVRPYPETAAYTDFLLSTAANSEVDEIVAAMTPCMRLYAYLGKELAAQTVGASRAGHPYREWIETYGGEEFQAAAARLESLLDRLATDRPAIRTAYRYAMECELRFFTAPLTAEQAGSSPASRDQNDRIRTKEGG